MKSIFKLIPAVLAGIALAGCSSDDLYTNGEQPIEYTANDLEVNFTPFEEEGIMRAAWSNNQLSTFQDGDAIRVYDETLTTFDKYTFGDGKFTKGDGTRIGTPKFALFPSKYVSYGEWKENGDVIAVIQVPSVIKYDATSEIAQGDEIAYVSEVPAFGTPTDKGTHLAVEDLTALTAVYRVTLNGIKGNHNFLKIQAANSNLSGKFDAVLTADKPQLVQSPDLVGKNYIIVDLQSVPSTRTVLYIPIIPGEYPEASNQFTVQVSNDADAAWTDEAKANPETVVETADAWMNLDPAVTGDKTFKVNQVRGLTRAFELNVTTTEELSRLLKTDKNLTGDVAYQLKELDINRNEDYTDYTIEVPNMKANSLTIGVTDLKNNVTAGQKLVIKHADAEDPYTKKVLLNVSAITGTGDTPVEIDLPECDVQIIGDYANCSNITIKAAKSLAFGDGTTVTNVPNTVTTEQTESYVSTIKESITVTANATLGSPFTIVGANTGKNATFNVNIEGTTKAFVARYSEVTVSGDGQIGGTLYAYGDVTVESSQNNAITTLQYAGTGKTLNLKKGGISAIKTIDYTSGTPAVPATLNKLNITNVETGKSQIGDIEDHQTISAVDTKVLDVTFEKSVWFGEATTSTSMKDPEKIYTASQLASVAGGKSSYKLMTNIDLNNNPWAGINVTNGTFDGNQMTIENLALAAEGEKSAGLFNAITITEDLTIKNLTINGITTTGVVPTTGATPEYPTAIGGVIGALTLADTKTLTLSNVEISSTANDFGVSYTQTGYVGGLIGKVTGSTGESGQVIIKGKDAKSTVALKSIKGHAYLGGLVGGVAEKGAPITISKYNVTLTNGFSVNIASGIDTDYSYPEFGTVGMYIGQARGNVEYDASNATNNINGKRVALGFKYNHSTTGTPGILYRYYGSNVNVGYSPAVTQVTEGSTNASSVTTAYKTWTDYNTSTVMDKLNPNIFIKSNDYPE